MPLHHQRRDNAHAHVSRTVASHHISSTSVPADPLALPPVMQPAPRIIDQQPQRTHNYMDLMHAAAALGIMLITCLAMYFLQGTTRGVERDVHRVSHITDWLLVIPATALQQLTLLLILIPVLLRLFKERAWLQAVSALFALMLGYASAWACSAVIWHVQPLAMIHMLNTTGATPPMGLLPDTFTALAAFLSMAGTIRSRSSTRWSWNAVLSVGAVLIITSWYSLAGIVLALCLGRVIGVLMRFGIGTASTGIWGMHIVTALRQIGLSVASLQRIEDNSLPDEPSLGALAKLSPLDDLNEHARRYWARDWNGTRYIVSIIDSQTHVVGYVSQVWQWLRLSGIAIRRDRSVSDANRHHAAMLLGLAHIGLPTVPFYGIADAGESSLLVLYDRSPDHSPARSHSANSSAYEAAHDDINAAAAVPKPDPSHATSTTINADTASEPPCAMSAYMHYLHQAHQRGFTHQRLTAATLGTTHDGKAVIFGWQNGDCASPAANIMVDIVQLLALSVTMIGVEPTLAAARQVWSAAELTALAPLVQRIVIPQATQASPSWSKQHLSALRDALRNLQDEAEGSALDSSSASSDVLSSSAASAATSGLPTQPLVSSRFSLRSFIAIALTGTALVVIFTQLHPHEVIAALQHAQALPALACLICSALAWVASAFTLQPFMTRARGDWRAILHTQIAVGFAEITMPAGLGPAFINLQFLRKVGYTNTQATAVASACAMVQGITTFLMLAAIGLLTGRNTLAGLVPGNTLIMALIALTLIICIMLSIPALRNFFITRYWPLLRAYAKQLLSMLIEPSKLLPAAASAFALNMTFSFGFWFALLAFGQSMNPLEVIFLFSLANFIGGAIPTPGGLGSIEAALIFAFTSVGVPSAVALSATLIYRLAFYWLRIPIGALSMRWLTARNLI